MSVQSDPNDYTPKPDGRTIFEIVSAARSTMKVQRSKRQEIRRERGGGIKNFFRKGN